MGPGPVGKGFQDPANKGGGRCKEGLEETSKAVIATAWKRRQEERRKTSGGHADVTPRKAQMGAQMHASVLRW